MSGAVTGLIPVARRITLAFLSLVLTGTLLAAPAAAAARDHALARNQAAAQNQIAAQDQVETQQQPSELAPVMLILDASGSMNEPDPSGGTKMDAAKAAVRSLTQQVPAGAQLGLTVYGTGTGNSEAERAAGCQDVQVLLPVGSTDAAGVAQAADGLQASGYTPIGRSLEVAAGALPAEGPRSIVLVSDGIDTCAPPDPCEIARQLAAQGIDLQVHVVGFAVDAQARTQLACIAEATGGTYADAANADELGTALNQITAKALRVYEAVGIPIEGGTDQAGAPTVGPGAYLDDQVPAGQTRYYAVEVPAGYTLYATATVIYSAGAGVGELLEAEILAQDVTGCQWTNDAPIPGDPMTSLVLRHTVPAGEGGGDACQGPGRFTFTIGRDGGGPPTDVELLFGLEPPPAGEPPAAQATQPVAFSPPSTQPVAVTGGGSFNTAATLDGSGRYTDVIQAGEAVFYRVRLDWGQGFAYQLHLDDGGASNQVVQSAWYSAQREQVDWDNLAYSGQAAKLPGTQEAFASLPVQYANRNGLSPGLGADVEGRGTSVAGWYYISIFYGNTGQTAPGEPPLPVTIDLAVAGEPQAPPYAVAEGEPTDAFGGENLGAPEPPAAGGGRGAGGETGTGPFDLLNGRSLLGWGAVAVVVLVIVLLVVLVMMFALRDGRG